MLWYCKYTKSTFSDDAIKGNEEMSDYIEAKCTHMIPRALWKFDLPAGVRTAQNILKLLVEHHAP